MSKLTKQMIRMAMTVRSIKDGTAAEGTDGFKLLDNGSVKVPEASIELCEKLVKADLMEGGPEDGTYYPVMDMDELTLLKPGKLPAADNGAGSSAEEVEKAPKAPRIKKSKGLGVCLCGCGGTTTGFFRPGHDAKMSAAIRNEIGTLERKLKGDRLTEASQIITHILAHEEVQELLLTMPHFESDVRTLLEMGIPASPESEEQPTA